MPSTPQLASYALPRHGVQNYATSKVNTHSCQLKLDLEENKGGHPILKFPKPTQHDLNNVPTKYRKASELQQTHITARWKVHFETEINDVNKIDNDDSRSFVHEADMVAIKKGTRKKLFGNVMDALEAYKEGAKERPLPQPVWHVDATIKKRRRLSTMEICTWTMMVTMIAMQKGWDTWQPITIEPGYDPTTDKGNAMAKMEIEKAKPDVIVFAWGCTPWTLMQNMNNKVLGHAERLAQQRSLHLEMLAFAEWRERRQSANCGLFLGENPMGSIAWRQPQCLRMSRRCYEVELDQCMFRRCAPDTQESIKKPTKMLTTGFSAASNLSIRCDGSHPHRTIGGSVNYSKNGRQVRQTLSEFCGGHTQEMATDMVLGFEDNLIPMNHLANVVSRKRALDELEEEAARRVARRVGDQEPASSSTDEKKKRRRDFAEELREMTQRAKTKIPKPKTRSMTRGSASQEGAAQQDDNQENSHNTSRKPWDTGSLTWRRTSPTSSRSSKITIKSEILMKRRCRTSRTRITTTRRRRKLETTILHYGMNMNKF